MRRLATFGTILCAGALLAHADTDETRKRLERELQNIPAPELPARAVAIVRSTPAGERSQAAIIAVETVSRQRPTAVAAVSAAIAKAAPETIASLETASHGQKGGKGKSEIEHGNGGENGNAGGNGGVGHGPGDNKPGKPVVHDRPIKTILPNGKPRHFPPDPPHRPVNPPRPHKYNRPHPHD